MMAFKTAEHRIAQSQVGAWKPKHKAPVTLLNINGIEAFIGDNLPDMSIPQEEYEYKAGKRLWQRVICEDVISSIVIGSPVGILDSPDVMEFNDVNFAKKELGIEEWDSEA